MDTFYPNSILLSNCNKESLRAVSYLGSTNKGFFQTSHTVFEKWDISL